MMRDQADVYSIWTLGSFGFRDLALYGDAVSRLPPFVALLVDPNSVAFAAPKPTRLLTQRLLLNRERESFSQIGGQEAVPDAGVRSTENSRG